MCAQADEEARHLAGRFVGKVLPQLLVGKTTDEELALHQGTKQTGILFREEIEALVTAVILGLGFGQAVQFFYAHLRGSDGRDELEVTLISGGEQFTAKQVGCEWSSSWVPNAYWRYRCDVALRGSV